MRGSDSLAVGIIARAALIGWPVWHQNKNAAPPAVDLRDIDPEAAAAIHQARATIQLPPRSGAASGRLGMMLFAHDFSGAAATLSGSSGGARCQRPSLALLPKRDFAFERRRRCHSLCATRR